MQKLTIEPSTATDVAHLQWLLQKYTCILILKNPRIPSSCYFCFPQYHLINWQEENFWNMVTHRSWGPPMVFFNGTVSTVPHLKFISKDLAAKIKRYSIQFIDKQRERKMTRIAMTYDNMKSIFEILAIATWMWGQWTTSFKLHMVSSFE